MSVHLARSDHSSVLVASMHGGRANALDPATVGGLAEAVTGLDGHEALVVTGLPGVFTGGLDLAILNGGGEPADSLQAAMGHLLLEVLQSRRPIVVAADGHAVAAGAMLMLAADLALVSDRPARYGFTEVRGGMPLPAAVVELITARANPAAALRLAAHAEIVGPDGAVALGLADEVVPQTELLPAAVARAAELAALPTDAYATTKLRVTERLRNTMKTALTR